MFNIPNENLKLNDGVNLKSRSIKLNFKWDEAKVFLTTQGSESEKFCSKKNYKYILFVDENNEVYLTKNDSETRSVLLNLGYIYVQDDGLLHYPINENYLEVKKYLNGSFENTYDESFVKNYESYKDVVGDKALELISLYGLDYNVLPIEHGSKGYATSVNTASSKIYLNISYYPTVGEFAKYKIINEENIIVCLDEYGRLFALQFNNVIKLNEAVEILKRANFKEGLTCYLDGLMTYRIEKQDDAFKVLLKRIEKINNNKK